MSDFFERFELKTRDLVDLVLSARCLDMGETTDVNTAEWEAIQELAVSIELNLMDYDKPPAPVVEPKELGGN